MRHAETLIGKEIKMSKTTVGFFTLCLLMVGTLCVSVPSGYSMGFYLICLFGFALWLRERDQLVSQDIIFLLLPLLLFAAVHLALTLFEQMAIREVGTYLTFIWVFFGVWAIRKYKPNAEMFWLGLSVGAILAAAIASYQAYAFGGRAGGFTNPIQFGNIALLMGVLCFVKVLASTRFNRLAVLAFVGFFSGILASIWSQSRGGWVAIPLIFAWIFTVTTNHWTRKKKVFLVGVTVLFLFTAVSFPNSVVSKRLTETVNELNAFSISGEKNTSVGVRLAMWRVAVDEIKHSPLLGLGQHGWIQARNSAIEDGRLGFHAGELGHVHNEFLDIAVKKGLIGLSAYLVLMLVPMLFFFGPNKAHPNPEVRTLAIAGMVVPMMFMDFGLTQTFLSHNSGRVVLCSFWMCLAGLMLNALDEHNKLPQASE